MLEDSWRAVACRWVHWDPCWWLWTMKTVWAVQAAFKQYWWTTRGLCWVTVVAPVHTQVGSCNSCSCDRFQDDSECVKATFLWQCYSAAAHVIGLQSPEALHQALHKCIEFVWHHVHMSEYAIKCTWSRLSLPLLVHSCWLAMYLRKTCQVAMFVYPNACQIQTGLSFLDGLQVLQGKKQCKPSYNEFVTPSDKKASTASNTKTRTKPTTCTVAMCLTIWLSISARFCHLCSLRSMFLHISSRIHAGNAPSACWLQPALQANGTTIDPYFMPRPC